MEEEQTLRTDNRVLEDIESIKRQMELLRQEVAFLKEENQNLWQELRNLAINNSGDSHKRVASQDIKGSENGHEIDDKYEDYRHRESPSSPPPAKRLKTTETRSPRSRSRSRERDERRSRDTDTRSRYSPGRRDRSPYEGRSKREEEYEPRRLLVSNLPAGTRSSDIERLFEGCGKLSNIVRRHSTRSKGLVQFFVSFETDELTDKAMRRSGEMVLGRRAIITRAMLRSSDKQTEHLSSDTPSVYAYNLPEDIQHSELTQVFSECGTIKNIHIMRDKCAARIYFSTWEEAERGYKLHHQLKIGDLLLKVDLPNRNVK